MGGGSGSGNTTTTQKADPWIGVQPYLTQGYQQLANLYQPGQGPQYNPANQVAPPDPMTALGQNNTLAGLAGMNNLANSAYANLNNMGIYGKASAAAGADAVSGGLSGMSNLANQTAGGINGANNAMYALLSNGQSGGVQAGTGGQISAMQQLAQAGNFGNNPAYQAALQSAIRPVTQQFQEQVLPGIQQGAQAAGQMGGSRQGIAEGIAARGYQDTVGDISANMGNAAYAQGLQALQASGQLGQGLTAQGLGALSSAGQLGSGLGGLSAQLQSGIGSLGANLMGQGITGLGQATALAPGAIQSFGLPGQIIGDVGNQRQAQSQAQINADTARWDYNQNLPYSMISDYLSMLNGAQGGQTMSQQSGGGGSRATGALGGAATGAAIGGSFGGPWGAGIGAGAGALYGLFM